MKLKKQLKMTKNNPGQLRLTYQNLNLSHEIEIIS